MTPILPVTTSDDIELNLFIYNNTPLCDRHIINKCDHLFSKIRFQNKIFNEMHSNDNFETGMFDDADHNDSACKYYDVNVINLNHKSLSIDVKFTCIHMNCRSIAVNFDALVLFLNEFEFEFDIIVLRHGCKIYQRYYTILMNM